MFSNVVVEANVVAVVDGVASVNVIEEASSVVVASVAVIEEPSSVLVLPLLQL